MRAERILGSISGAIYIGGILLVLFGDFGGSFLIALSVLILILGYFPVHLSRQWRIRSGKQERLFHLMKFLTAFAVMTGFMLKVSQSSITSLFLLIGSFMLAGLMLYYFILRQRKIIALPIRINDIVIAVFCFGMFLYLNDIQVSTTTMEGYQQLDDRYVKFNAGVEGSNEMIYSSIEATSVLEDPEMLGSLDTLRNRSAALRRLCDTCRAMIIGYGLDSAYYESREEIKQQHAILASTFIGAEVMIVYGWGQELKDRIDTYREYALQMADRHNLSSGLIGQGLDTEVPDSWDGPPFWEIYMFELNTVGSILVNLSWIKQMVLQTEANILNEVLGRVDLTDEARLLQELASRESEQAMELKENEIVRMRQAQELHDLELWQSEAETRQQRIMFISALAGIGLILVLLVISTRAFYLKREDNKSLARQQKEISSMNETLNQRNEEIMAQNDEILAQRDEIEAQRDLVLNQKELIERSHRDVSSSIDYARRLQTSILPSPGLLKTRIRDHFVLFLPKHRVSGDFYWWTQIEDQVVITAADCTGHGVPGAFMSMLGVSMLREIVSKEYISHPGVILRRLRKEVMYALKQTGEFGEQKDGMDMALVSINVETLECQYAGANNPLYLVRNGDLTEYKADRMPIAIHQNMAKFTTHEIQLQRGDRLYLFSDGYADQFGGPDGKKFKFNQFRQLLTENATLSMKKQRQAVEQTFLEWQGENEQVDDVVVLGLEI